MVANKIVLAVAIAFVAFVQIDARPAEGEIPWLSHYENALKNFTNQFSELTGNTTEYTSLAKEGLNSFADSLKANLTSLYTTIQSKTEVPDVVKEGVKQWQEAVEKYAKKNPEELLDVKKYNEQFGNALKYMAKTATELSNKAQGNTDVEKTIKDFTKKQIDGLLEQVKSIQNKLGGNQA